MFPAQPCCSEQKSLAGRCEVARGREPTILHVENSWAGRKYLYFYNKINYTSPDVCVLHVENLSRYVRASGLTQEGLAWAWYLR